MLEREHFYSDGKIQAICICISSWLKDDSCDDFILVCESQFGFQKNEKKWWCFNFCFKDGLKFAELI